jgi:hypothetical protein
MLSDSNIREINRQIKNELGDLWHLDHQEKMEAFERIAELKRILEPSITIEHIEDLDQPSLPADLTIDLKRIFEAFRR